MNKIRATALPTATGGMARSHGGRAMRRVVAAVLLLACGASAALADPITDRENLMKGVQAATKDANGLAKGTTPWDAAKAKAAAQVYIDAAAKLPTLFPKGSE